MTTSPGQNGSGLVPSSTLMPGMAPDLRDDLHQRRAVLGLLPDGLVIEDDAGNVLHALGRAEQQLAIVAAIVFGQLHADGFETLLDGAGEFVGGENAAAGRRHGLRHLVQFSEIHSFLSIYLVIPGRPAGPNPESITPVFRSSIPPGLCDFGSPLRGVRNDINNYRTLSTSTPGKALPSSHSRKAPPAVET